MPGFIQGWPQNYIASLWTQYSFFDIYSVSSTRWTETSWVVGEAVSIHERRDDLETWITVNKELKPSPGSSTKVGNLKLHFTVILLTVDTVVVVLHVDISMLDVTMTIHVVTVIFHGIIFCKISFVVAL